MTFWKLIIVSLPLSCLSPPPYHSLLLSSALCSSISSFPFIEASLTTEVFVKVIKACRILLNVNTQNCNEFSCLLGSWFLQSKAPSRSVFTKVIVCLAFHCCSKTDSICALPCILCQLRELGCSWSGKQSSCEIKLWGEIVFQFESSLIGSQHNCCC